MARLSKTFGENPEQDSRARELLQLVEGTTSSISKDIDRYYFKEREFQNYRFMVTFFVFAMYAAMALIFIQVTLRLGTTSMSELVGSSKLNVGLIVILIGVPIITSLLIRSRESLKTLRMFRQHLRLELEFAEEFLARVSDWEGEFKSSKYYRPTLRLRVAMLSQLMDEMRLIVKAEPRFRFF